jgi:hypothetical protein
MMTELLAILAAIGSFAFGVMMYFWTRRKKKDEDLRDYLKTQKELEDEHRNFPKGPDAARDALRERMRDKR